MEEVSELHEFSGKECEPGEDQDDPCRWAKIQSSRHLESPWQPGTSYRQYPSHTLVFSVWPAPGCEEMNIGVCTFPQFVCPKRKEQPARRPTPKCSSTGPHGPWQSPMPDTIPAAARVLKQFAKRWKLRRLRVVERLHPQPRNHRLGCILPGCASATVAIRAIVAAMRPSWVLVEMEDRMQEYVRWRFQGTVDEAKALLCFTRNSRPIWTGLSGARSMSSPAKREHGAPSARPNTRTILQQAASPTSSVPIFRSVPFWKRPGNLASRSRSATKADFWTKRDVKALAEEVGQWDAMIAGLFGVLKDAAPDGLVLDSAIAGRHDFEQLEMKAQSGEIGKMLDKIQAIPAPKSRGGG